MTAAVAKASTVSVIDAFTDAQLLGNSFAGDTREAWRAILSAAFGLNLTTPRARLFDRLAGGRKPPSKRVRELWAIAGRRSDKSHTAGGIAVYLATIGAQLDGTLDRLTAGERGVVLVLAVDRVQARVVLSYIRGLLADSPVLSGMVAKETTDGVLLTNGASIEVATNSHRAVRGRTLLAAILDECAFYRDEASATPDIEVYRALVPSLATTGGMLVGISSPYARRGLLFEKWRKHYGRDDDVLVVQGETLDFNPTLDRRIIEEAEADDPEAAKAEWRGQFRDDVESFLTRDVVEQAQRHDPLELPWMREHRYSAFTDPAGGGADEFTLAIGHREDETAVVDLVRARRGTPADIVAEYARLLKSYGLKTVTGDKYAGSWPADEFERHGIKYVSADKPRSGLYLDLLPALNSGRVELPPDPRLASQLIGLERRTSRAGKDSIDHPPGGSDDRSNATAGVVAALSGPQRMSYAEALKYAL